MRLLHTADWHLGRIFHGVHLTGDQAHLLDQVLDLVRDEGVDAVLIAGDVYDRAVPPADAVRLLGETLDRLVHDLGVAVVLVAGNHDSPERIGFCSGALAAAGLHVIGQLPSDPKPLALADAHGPVEVTALPFVDPIQARAAFSDPSLTDHNRAFQEAIRRTCPSERTARRKILVAHAFVTGGLSSESERPLTVGGAGSVDAAGLSGFDYVALGHLHRPQQIGAPHVRYAGSLMPYSFSEAAHATSVCLVELGERGFESARPVPLSPRRRIRSIEGSLAELLARAEADPAPDDYLQAVLTDPGLLHDPLGQLRKRYPNLLQIVRPQLAPGGPDGDLIRERQRVSVLDLFASFYEHKREQALDEARRQVFTQVVDALQRRDREG